MFSPGEESEADGMKKGRLGKNIILIITTTIKIVIIIIIIIFAIVVITSPSKWS